jgi:hypothetical protein
MKSEHDVEIIMSTSPMSDAKCAYYSNISHDNQIPFKSPQAAEPRLVLRWPRTATLSRRRAW